jgi:O-antigen/teichoic acid export membrane protein
LARLLNPDEYGLLFLTISILGIFRIFSTLGIPKSCAKYISQYKEVEPKLVRYVIRTSYLLIILSMSVMILLLLLSHRYISSLVGEPQLSTFLLVGVGFIISTTFLSIVQAPLWGFEAIQDRAILQALTDASRLCFAFGFVLLGWGGLGAFAGYIIAPAIAACLGFPYFYFRYYQNCEENNNNSNNKELAKKIIRYAIPLTATNASKILDNRNDILLIAFFVDSTAVGFYTIGKQITRFLHSPLSALATTLSPTFQAQKAKGNPEIATKIYKESISHGLIFYFTAGAGLIIIAEPAINIILGTEYSDAIPVLRVLTIWGLLQSVMTISNQALDFLGRAKTRAIAFGASSGINFILNIVFIPMYGIVGAAVATVISYSLYTLSVLYIIFDELNIKKKWFMLQIKDAIFVASIISFPTYVANFYINNIFSLFLIIGMSSISWLVVVAWFGLIDVKQIYHSIT